MNYLILGLVFIFGAVWASFLNVVIWRLPRGKRIIGRSACVHCGRQLRAHQLIPIASFLIQRGRCSHCRKKISWRYPIIEFCLGLMFLLVWLSISPSSARDYFQVARLWLLMAFALTIFMIDLEHFLILDAAVFPAAVSFLLLNFLQDWSGHFSHGASFSGLVAALIAVAPFYLIWKFSHGRLMGFGDVKLILPLGLALGFPRIIAGLFLAVGLGSVVGIGLLVFKKAKLRSPLPFGCFLAIGAVVAAIYGQNLVNWYLSLFGV